MEAAAALESPSQSNASQADTPADGYAEVFAEANRAAEHDRHQPALFDLQPNPADVAGAQPLHGTPRPPRSPPPGRQGRQTPPPDRQARRSALEPGRRRRRRRRAGGDRRVGRSDKHRSSPHCAPTSTPQPVGAPTRQPTSTTTSPTPPDAATQVSSSTRQARSRRRPPSRRSTTCRSTVCAPDGGGPAPCGSATSERLNLSRRRDRLTQ